MSEESPPTYTTSIFNQANFVTAAESLDIAYLNSHYLRYPTAQTGTETIPNLATTNDATINGLSVGRGGGNVSSNTAFGASALAANTATGIENTAIGDGALQSATTASQNTALGHEALYNITTTGTHTAIGFHAARNATGSTNLAIGYRALKGTFGSNTGSNNMAIGEDSLLNITSGANNTAIGHYSLKANTTASDNTAFGYNSLTSNTTGGSNMAIGTNALSSNIIGSNNTSVGVSSLNSTTGSNNTALGYLAGQAGTPNTTGTENTYIGYQAQANGGAYTKSTALGSGATITASNQIVLGTSTETTTFVGRLSTTLNNTNLVLGYQSLYSTTNGDNTGYGYNVFTTIDTTGAAVKNTAIGSNALKITTTGDSNTAVGYKSLTANTTGSNNTAIGNQSLFTNTTSGANTAVGASALELNTGGSNTAVGFATLSANTSGAANIAVGGVALASTTTGNNNTAIGYEAGQAGTANTTGSNNTYVGYQAQATGSAYSNSTALGSGATITASNQVVLGTASEKVVIPNQINFSYSSNPTLAVGSLGYNYQYTFTTSSILAAGNKIIADFTNTPIGIYLLFCNFTAFDLSTSSRVDIQNFTATNITYLSSSTSLEYGGNNIGKIGINFSYPLKITSATNQLTIYFVNVAGGTVSITAGASSLLRIA